jgi:hypothetical protein
MQMMSLSLTSLCVTGRIFIVVSEEKEEKEIIEKVPIEEMYYEILLFLNEPVYESPKRGKMTMYKKI